MAQPLVVWLVLLHSRSFSPVCYDGHLAHGQATNKAELLWYIYDAAYSRKAVAMPAFSGLTPQRAALTILPILCCMETA